MKRLRPFVARWRLALGFVLGALVGAAITSPLIYFVVLPRFAAPAPVVAVLAGPLAISVPERSAVGETLDVIIRHPDAPDGMPATVIATDSYGPQVLDGTFRAGVARVTLATTNTRRSGVLMLRARAGNAQGGAQVRLVAGDPVDPLTPLVGPRSIIADTKHWSMITVVPFDKYGNPMEDGTPIDLRALRPDGDEQHEALAVRNLVAWTRLWSGTQAGRTTVAMRAATAYGPEEALSEVAGWPQTISVSAEPRSLPADGRRMLSLRTAPMEDRYGNLVPDGTSITFVIAGQEGDERRVPAYTIDGIAEVPLLTPTSPQRLRVWATMYGVESAPFDIDFGPGPAVGTFPVEAEIDDARGAVRVTAGPLLGSLGQFVPDGTVVTFTITDAHGRTVRTTGTADAGWAAAEFRMLALGAGTFRVSAQAGAGIGTTDIVLP